MLSPVLVFYGLAEDLASVTRLLISLTIPRKKGAGIRRQQQRTKGAAERNLGSRGREPTVAKTSALTFAPSGGKQGCNALNHVANGLLGWQQPAGTGWGEGRGRSRGTRWVKLR